MPPRKVDRPPTPDFKQLYYKRAEKVVSDKLCAKIVQLMLVNTKKFDQKDVVHKCKQKMMEGISQGSTEVFNDIMCAVDIK